VERRKRRGTPPQFSYDLASRWRKPSPEGKRFKENSREKRGGGTILFRRMASL